MEGMRCGSCGQWNTGSGPPLTLITLDQVEDEKIDRIQCGDWGFCFGGGIASATTSIIGGFPGSGKSTLILHMLAEMNVKAAYLATEEKLVRIRQRAERIGMSLERQKQISTVRMSTGEIPDLISIGKTHGLVLLDSISMLASSADEGVTIGRMLMALCEKTKTTAIATAHVTKGGDIAGMEALQHVGDCNMMMEVDETKDGAPRILTVLKNRNGMAYVSQVYTMGPNGLTIVGQDGATLD